MATPGTLTILTTRNLKLKLWRVRKLPGQQPIFTISTYRFHGVDPFEPPVLGNQLIQCRHPLWVEQDNILLVLEAYNKISNAAMEAEISDDDCRSVAD
jgi:hypothetical protein